MRVLVIGGTGTLGRQVVRAALDEGFVVRCLVRNLRKASFLNEWGAELYYGDYKRLETLPRAFSDVQVVIDVSTLRPNEENLTLKDVDLIGKVALIRAAQIANVKRFVFFSFCESNYLDVPLVQFKKTIENRIMKSGLNFTIFQVSGFYQGLINQYAVPILDQETIWLTNDESFTFNYLNSQDIAKLCILSLKTERTANLSFDLSNPIEWTSKSIIKACESLSGQTAKIQLIPIFILDLFRLLFSFNKWGWPIQDRLAFSKILDKPIMTLKSKNSRSLQELCELVNVSMDELLPLDSYLQEYFELMLSKLRNLNYDQTQINKRKDLTF